MKRFISLSLVFAMCLALISISAVSAFADTTKINISRVNQYNEDESEIVAWASNSATATIQTLYGDSQGVTFNYFYFILLQYNSANGSYTVINTSGFDAYGNSTRPDESYTEWTLGNNRVAIMAKTRAADQDGLNLLKSMSYGDTLYLNTTVASLANTYGAVSDIYFSTEPITNQPDIGGGSDDSSDPSEGENVLDLSITAPEYYELGEEFTVNVYVNNITAENGISLLKFDLDYDKDKLELVTESNEENYGELLCVSALPNVTWENLSYAQNGSVAVQLLTPETDSANFAKNDEEIAFEFKFKAKETASGDSVISANNVVAAQNTADDVIRFVGNGNNVTVVQSPYVLDVLLNAPESCTVGKEFSVSASVCNIATENGISLIKFAIDYDETKFELTNEIDEEQYGKLIFESNIPNVTWENLSYVKDGVVYIQLLTPEIDPSNFATNDGGIDVVLTFKALEGATGVASFSVSDDSVVAGVNTEDDATVVLGRGSSASITVNSYEYTRGDIDNDGEITTADYILVKRTYMSTYTPNEIEFLAADVDEDGVITTADYILVKRAFMGTYEIV